MRTAPAMSITNHRAHTIEWARDLIDHPDKWVVLDTETTGLHSTDQVVQIAVLDGAGEVLVDNQLIRPTCDISFEAEMIHGISMDMLIDKPTFNEFAEKLRELLEDKIVVIYNSEFDMRMLAQSFIVDSGFTDHKLSFRTNCAMKQYARFVGDWVARRGDFRWQRLPAGTHDALGDCKAVYELIKIMAQAE